MRQAGVLAACGIVSLTQYVDRLAEDHKRARDLATELSEMPGLRVDWDTVQTNMVVVSTDESAEWWAEELHKRDIWCFPVASNRLRLVLHADIDDAGVERAAEVFKSIAAREKAHA